MTVEIIFLRDYIKKMNAVLNKNLFLINEQTGMNKASNCYNVCDPENNQILLNCKENKLGFFTKFLRVTKCKAMTPFQMEITSLTGEKLLSIKKSISIFRSKVQVFDGEGFKIGFFKQKVWSIGGDFEVIDRDLEPVCLLKIGWGAWNFKFIKDTYEIAKMNKNWDGIGKELFTTADNYMLQILDEKTNDTVRQLIMAVAICINMISNE